MQKCSDVLKKSSVEIYEEFYKTTIADNAEFKKIKKWMNAGWKIFSPFSSSSFLLEFVYVHVYLKN